jgi:argininosuccinate lyase
VTLWQGRLPGRPAPEMLAFTESLSFDRALASDDLEGSRAHVRGLQRAGLLSAEEAAILVTALDRVGEEIAEGRFEPTETDEDIHTAVERRVTEMAGEVGAKLHTGRSRNDQVATDLRLYTRRRLVEVAEGVLELQSALLERARSARGAYLPGYTHLQRAQPVLFAHHLLAHCWALARDVDRLAQSAARLNVCPLGAGALAGSSLPLDPEAVAADLGFAHSFENSLDAVSDRDFVAEAAFDLALLGVHLSRLGEELVLWSSEEFGFLRLPDAWSTGSSMLPQKKNPDVAELSRGKAGRLIGHVVAVLTMLKGLPLSYNRDLQEDKEPLFDGFGQVRAALAALVGLVRAAGFDTERMRRAADGEQGAAADLAEWMVARGTPFRDAHAVVASLVRQAAEQGTPLAPLVRAHPRLGPEAAYLLEPGVAVTRRTTPGGGGPGPVAVQLARFGERLHEDRARLGHA